jgi:NCS1 family nucleobase:cation symporter-1
MSDGQANPLWNPDLAPTGPGQRTWAWYHFASLWVGMIIAVSGWMLAGGLVEQGMSAGQATLTVLLGNVIVLIPMLLIGHAGARYGIPYAVLVRASFGTIGARLPALMRALVACGWYGIQTWIGGEALLALLGVLAGADLRGAPLPLLDIGAGQLLSFLAFWGIQLFFVRKGLLTIRRLETWTAPAKILICVALVWWAVDRAGGVGPVLAAPSAFAAGGPRAGQFWLVFWPALTAMVGYWATVVIYGRAIWDPVALAGTMAGPFVLIGLIVITVDTVSCNIAANLVSSAYDFSSLWPAKISYRTGGMITAMIGVLIMPWKLVATTNGYIFTWLAGYSALLGPIAGILIADYWLIRRARLDVDALYDARGRYAYRGGWNPAAIIAFAAGVLPNLPGFLKTAAPGAFGWIGPAWAAAYTYAWFTGLAVALALYAALMWRRR